MGLRDEADALNRRRTAAAETARKEREAQRRRTNWFRRHPWAGAHLAVPTTPPAQSAAVLEEIADAVPKRFWATGLIVHDYDGVERFNPRTPLLGRFASDTSTIRHLTIGEGRESYDGGTYNSPGGNYYAVQWLVELLEDGRVGRIVGLDHGRERIVHLLADGGMGQIQRTRTIRSIQRTYRR